MIETNHNLLSFILYCLKMHMYCTYTDDKVKFGRPFQASGYRFTKGLTQKLKLMHTFKACI